MKNLLFFLLILTACKKEPPVKPIEEHWSDVRKMIKVDSVTQYQEQ